MDILGSNIFNTLFVLGPAAMVKPFATEGIVGFDLPVMMAFTVVLFPFMLSGLTLRRWEGSLLLVGYVVYSYWHFR